MGDSHLRRFSLAGMDLLLWSLSYYAAYRLSLDIRGRPFGVYIPIFWQTLPWLLGIRLLCGLLVKQFSWSFRFASLAEAVALGKGAFVGTCLFVAFCHWVRIVDPTPPRSVYVIEFALSLMSTGLVRYMPRYLYQQFLQRSLHLRENGERPVRTLIFGVGNAGELIVRDLLRSRHPYQILGFVDDAPTKWGSSIHGIRVLGGSQDLPTFIERYRIDHLLIAVPNLPPARLRQIVDLCAHRHLRYTLVPNYADLVARGSGALTLKEVQLEDLMDRDPVNFDESRFRTFFEGKCVLVTGAAGSIGSELCRQIARYGVRRLIALDLNENAMYFLGMDLAEVAPSLDVGYEIASIRDPDRLEEIFERERPEIVFHAAAHKHVPAMERCPSEALKNNVLGTLYVVEAAERFGAERFVLISTDKAVRPTSVMGASKRLAEFLVQDRARRSRTRFMTVRFGNVLGSNGSLIQILQRQIAKGGPVTITHPQMTRYFMTIPEAVGLVLVAAVLDEGDLCILDMGKQLSVEQVVREMIILSGRIPEKEIPIIYTGLRPGEKMYEELSAPEEELRPSSHPKISIATTKDIPDLSILLQDLEKVLASKDDGEIRLFLKKYVPGYQPHGRGMGENQN